VTGDIFPDDLSLVQTDLLSRGCPIGIFFY
jgi:hypothetical protein